MRRCGLSARKLEYLRGLADAFGGGGAEVPKGKVSGARGGRFPKLSDEVLESASDAGGGRRRRATARRRAVEPPFQMFYLNRPDVLADGRFRGEGRGCRGCTPERDAHAGEDGGHRGEVGAVSNPQARHVESRGRGESPGADARGGRRVRLLTTDRRATVSGRRRRNECER